MGRSKEYQMEYDEKVKKVISLCVEVGAFKECPVHYGEYIDSYAYSDPNELTSRILEDIPDALELFDTRYDLVECVRDAMAYSGEECGYCEKNRDS